MSESELKLVSKPLSLRSEQSASMADFKAKFRQSLAV